MIFSGMSSVQGLDPLSRNSVWPYLLQVFKPEWDTNSVKQHQEKLASAYAELIASCEVTILPVPKQNSPRLASQTPLTVRASSQT